MTTTWNPRETRTVRAIAPRRVVRSPSDRTRLVTSRRPRSLASMVMSSAAMSQPAFRIPRTGSIGATGQRNEEAAVENTFSQVSRTSRACSGACGEQGPELLVDVGEQLGQDPRLAHDG